MKIEIYKSGEQIKELRIAQKMLILLNKCIIKEIRKNTLQENAGKNE